MSMRRPAQNVTRSLCGSRLTPLQTGSLTGVHPAGRAVRGGTLPASPATCRPGCSSSPDRRAVVDPWCVRAPWMRQRPPEFARRALLVSHGAAYQFCLLLKENSCSALSSVSSSSASSPVPLPGWWCRESRTCPSWRPSGWASLVRSSAVSWATCCSARIARTASSSRRGSSVRSSARSSCCCCGSSSAIVRVRASDWRTAWIDSRREGYRPVLTGRRSP